MDRRRFLHTAGPGLAALSLGLGGCNDGEPESLLMDAMGNLLPPLQWLTRDAAYTDYRPAVDLSGTQLVFERQPHPHPKDAPTLLYLAQGIDQPNPGLDLLVPPTAMVPVPFPDSQTRPDWSWAQGEIAFTGEVTGVNGTDVYLLSSDRSNLSVLSSARGHIYPNWTSDGTHLVLDNVNGTPDPVLPITALYSKGGSRQRANLNGSDTSSPPVQMFGGFAAPRPGTLDSIAYAGQPVLTTWGLPPGTTPPLSASYNQDNNYIFLNGRLGSGYVSSPMEAGASLQAYDPAYQGRAPYWSPDGQHIVFESSRAGGYALFLYHLQTGASPVQLTHTAYWAQHAKFFADGKRVVFSALQQAATDGSGPRGIAVIDISAYLT